MIFIGYNPRQTWTPSRLASCVGQYGSNTPNQATLATWTDAKAVMGDFTQATGSAKPSTNAAGLVVFDGVNDYLGLAASYNLGTSHTIAFRMSLTADCRLLTDFGGGGGNVYCVSGLGYSNGSVLSAAYATPASAANVVIKRNGTALTIYVNGSVFVTGTLGSNAAYGIDAVGNEAGSGYPLAGSVRRMAFFNEALSDADRALVEAWLSPAIPPPETVNLLLGLDDTDASKFLTTSGGSTVAGNGDPVGRWNPASWAPATYALQATAGQRCVRGAVGVTGDTGKWLDLSAALPLTGPCTIYAVADPSVSPADIVPLCDINGYGVGMLSDGNSYVFMASRDQGISPGWSSTLAAIRFRRDASDNWFLKYTGASEVAFALPAGDTWNADRIMGYQYGTVYQAPTTKTRATLVYDADCGPTGFVATEAWILATYGVSP